MHVIIPRAHNIKEELLIIQLAVFEDIYFRGKFKKPQILNLENFQLCIDND